MFLCSITFKMTTRKLPKWLEDCKNKSSNSTSDNANVELGERKENDNPRTGYRLRSSGIKSESPKDNYKDEDEEFLSSTQHLPFVEYTGRVEYYTDFHDIAIASDELMKWVDAQDKDIVPIAFDMEWPFSFQTGPGKSAVIQLCAEVNVCYVFHISQLKKLPAALVHFLQHSKVRLHGVNIKNDCRKLGRDFEEVDSQLMIDHCVDLGVWCNKVINSSGRWSMARLVCHICKLQINKDPKVRMSKWHIQPLTKEQQIYAAIDVYIAQVIYYDLEQRQQEKIEKEKAFVEKYGEEAYKLVMNLS
ncbi:Werner Syndrome-like exonuclease isoform X2 [Bradysia coprophila]|uniref:Werner Syndrome-like exonuclease isoform X2 n=1 Tax=Bradysia coprophila TaxID=38358 RepID=UPI00187D7BFD|nr:Werner Syndrome-like exonuclease isoform X2 [Bradysia coprophila]